MNLVKQLRRDAGLSQQAFATACTLSVRAVAKYEAGAEPDITALLKLRYFADRHGRDTAQMNDIIESKLGFSLSPSVAPGMFSRRGANIPVPRKKLHGNF